MSKETLPFARGKTFNDGNPIDSANLGGTHLEGMVKRFRSLNPSDATLARDEQDVTGIIVRNTSGITLLPKRACRWATTYFGRRVDGYSTTTAAPIAGFVDDMLPTTGVVANDLFWLLIAGPILAKTPLAGASFAEDIAEGDVLFALTGATSQCTTSGRLKRWNTTFSAAETTDGTGASIQLYAVGRALSAKTTGNTDADILVHVAKRFV